MKLLSKKTCTCFKSVLSTNGSDNNRSLTEPKVFNVRAIPTRRLSVIKKSPGCSQAEYFETIAYRFSTNKLLHALTAEISDHVFINTLYLERASLKNYDWADQIRVEPCSICQQFHFEALPTCQRDCQRDTFMKFSRSLRRKLSVMNGTFTSHSCCQ